MNIRNLPIEEQEFYLNDKNKIEYNDKCESCANECKQSFKSQILQCRKNIVVKTKSEYLAEIEKQNKTVQEVAKKIDMNSRTLNSVLTNVKKDIDFVTHTKLMQELYKETIEAPKKTKK